jgi:DamX protein
VIGVFKKKPELPEYLAHYGMHRAPFSAAIENDMYYVEPARKQRLDVLLHLTQYTNELLVVTGEQGTGKTMFLQQFINSAGEHWKICAMQGHKMMTEEQFLQQVYLGFGIAHASIHKTTMLTNLKKRLDSQLEQALPVILLVDDAHLFSSKVLSLILELASIRNVTSGTSVRVILFSEPQIKIILAEPELDEKHRLIVRKIDLPPLDESHTGDYLYHRLSQAGMATEQFLTQQTIRKIYKQSNGIPARINEAADKLLFETTPIIRRTSNVQAQKKMAGMKYVVIVVLLGIALASYLFQKYFNTTIRDTSEATETEQTTAQPAETVTEKTVTPLKLPELDSTKEIKVDNEIQAEQSTRPPDAIDPMQSLKEELASKTAEPAAAPEPAPAQPAAAEKIQYEQDAPAETQSITPLGPAPTIAIQQPPAEVLPKDAKWVMQQNPEHFTLQLVTGRQQATIDRFIAQHGLQPQMLAYFYSYRNEKNWHNLIYGVYPDRAEAAAAIKQLPPELAAIKPWIRQYRSIQSEIAQVR